VSWRLGGVGKWGDSVVICISELIIVRSVVSYYVCCRMICTCVFFLYIYNVQYHTK